MERLPKKYFGSISDYVKTYYTAWGVTSFADKAYTAIKTVTKDFTRTDPVYVRVGEDGEPEIHYTMTKANGYGFFANMDFGESKPSIYLHNAKILTEVGDMFRSNRGASRIVFDSAPNITALNAIMYGCNAKSMTIPGSLSKIDALYYAYAVCDIEELNIDFTGSKPTNVLNAFYSCSLRVVPAIDLSAVEHSDGFASYSSHIEEFHAYGMKASFDLSYAALKHDAILEVFNNLGTVDKTAGITLTLGSAKLALMSDAEKAIATEKGWTLA